MDNCKISQFFHSSDSFLLTVALNSWIYPTSGPDRARSHKQICVYPKLFWLQISFLKKHPRSIPLFAQHISLNGTLVWRISLNATIAGHICSSNHIARVNKSTKLSRSIANLLVQFVHPVKLNRKKAVEIRSFIWMLNIYVAPCWVWRWIRSMRIRSVLDNRLLLLCSVIFCTSAKWNNPSTV